MEQKNNKVTMSARIEKDVLSKLKEHCGKNDIGIGDFISSAIEEKLNGNRAQLENHQQKLMFRLYYKNIISKQHKIFEKEMVTYTPTEELLCLCFYSTGTKQIIRSRNDQFEILDAKSGILLEKYYDIDLDQVDKENLEVFSYFAIYEIIDSRDKNEYLIDNHIIIRPSEDNHMQYFHLDNVKRMKKNDISLDYLSSINPLLDLERKLDIIALISPKIELADLNEYL